MPTAITLEDVNKEKDFANVESVVDVTYDEAGNRLWYSVDNRVRNEKWIEVTLPGIGVFHSQDVDAANPAYELVREDLVAGGYRDEAGHAHFPVLDAVSIRVTLAWLKPRSYIEGDILRRLNGGAVLPKHSFGASVQGKTFDGEHGKYYFGARYFDPFFGMWMSPDPAGQFSNPYTYGGDPINFVDPNGEFAFVPVLISAAIGAIVSGATTYANCSDKDGCGWEALQMAGVGGAAGAAGGAAAGAISGVSASAVGSVGLSTQSGAFAASAGGAIEGAASGLASSAVTYSLTTDSWNFGEFALSSWVGCMSGYLIGGMMGSWRYELSENFRQQTIDVIENYANKHGLHMDALKFDVAMGLKQRAVGYYANTVRGYNDIEIKYQAISRGTTRDHYDGEINNIEIFDEAFLINGKEDITSMMATIDHEYNHFKYNPKWIAKAKEVGFKEFGWRMKDGVIHPKLGTAFVEASNYHMGMSQGKIFGYSDAVKEYLANRYQAYSNWQSRLVIEGAY